MFSNIILSKIILFLVTYSIYKNLNVLYVSTYSQEFFLNSSDKYIHI